MRRGDGPYNLHSAESRENPESGSPRAYLGLKRGKKPIVFGWKEIRSLENSGICAVVLGAFSELRKTTVSFVMSVSLSGRNSSVSTGRILMKFGIRDFFRKSVELLVLLRISCLYTKLNSLAYILKLETADFSETLVATCLLYGWHNPKSYTATWFSFLKTQGRGSSTTLVRLLLYRTVRRHVLHNCDRIYLRSPSLSRCVSHSGSVEINIFKAVSLPYIPPYLTFRNSAFCLKFLD